MRILTIIVGPWCGVNLRRELVSKIRKSHRLLMRRSWFDKLTTNGLVAPVRPEPVEGRDEAIFETGCRTVYPPNITARR